MRTPPPRARNDVFSAAALLITLVVLTTILIAWAGSQHSSAYIKKQWSALSAEPAPAPVKPESKTASEKPPHPKPHTDEPHSASISKPTPVAIPVAPTNTVAAVTSARRDSRRPAREPG